MNISQKTAENLNKTFQDEQAKKLITAGLVPASMQIVNLKDSKIPIDAKKCFLSIATSVTKIDESLQKIYIIDNIPLMGKVIRMFVVNKEKAEARIDKEYKDINSYGELRSYIGGEDTLLSVYYDDKSILGIMSKPYIEMYNFIEDPSRFYPDETRDIREKTIELIEQVKKEGRS